MPCAAWVDENCPSTCTKFGASGEPEPNPNPGLEDIGTRPGRSDSPIVSERLGNVSASRQPRLSRPIVMCVTVLPPDTSNAMAVPSDVVPIHSPAYVRPRPSGLVAAGAGALAADVSEQQQCDIHMMIERPFRHRRLRV